MEKVEGNEVTKGKGNSAEEVSDEEEQEIRRQPRVNKFAVAFLGSEQSEEEQTETADDEENLKNDGEGARQRQRKNGGKNKKRKSTKKQQQKAEDGNTNNGQQQHVPTSPDNATTTEGRNQSNLMDDAALLETLLKVDPRCLNPDTELRRLLGRTFGAQQRRQRQQQQQRRVGMAQLGGSRLTKPRWDWPPPRQIGLHLAPDEQRASLLKANTADGEERCAWFRFFHSVQYQNQQQFFWLCQKQMDHEGIMNDVLSQNPYHLDSLLTIAEMLNVQEDFQRARDSIERGIFACECAFPSNFQVFSPLFCLDYGWRENRAFFLLLHRHMFNHLQRRCFNTAFQFGKLILAKDPFGDPLGILLVIDFLALKGRSPEFLLDFFTYFKQKRRLDLLPNFLFSLPLAYLALCANETNAKIKSEREREAEKRLEEALLRFPFVLAQLLDRLQVQPDSAIDSNTYLSSTAIYREPVGSRLLAHIYVHHSAEELWRPNLAWLERATHLALPRLMKRRNELEEWAQTRKHSFVGLPLNLARHCILNGIRPSDAQLTQHLDELCGPNIVVDPCPPNDGRRQRYEPMSSDDLLQMHGLDVASNSQSAGEERSDVALQGIVGAFIRTLLPDQEQARLDLLIQTLRQRIGLNNGASTSAEPTLPATETDAATRERQQDNDTSENEGE